MKGPGLRLELDVRRVWQCPQCGKRRRWGGETVAALCECGREGCQMRLVETRRQVRSFAEAIARVQSYATQSEPRAAEETQEEPAAAAEAPAVLSESEVPAPLPEGE